MQCVSCHFENIPGSPVCGRCGTSMGLAGATLDVHPPRARPLAKRARRLWSWAGGLVPFRSGIPWVRRADLIPIFDLDLSVLHLGTLFRLIVPGWAQIHAGQRRRGRIFLFLYVALLLSGLVFCGTFPGSILLGLALSTHSSATVDIVLSHVRTDDFGRRMLYSIGVMFLLAVLVYAPVGWLVTRVASPRILQMPLPPFHAGDVVLVNQWAFRRSSPSPGQIVLYDMPIMRFITGPHEMHAAGGPMIGRILAGPSAQVRWEDRRLWVNGQESSFQPLSPGTGPTQLSLKVPEGCYFILPTGTPAAAMETGIWTSLSCIPTAGIHGLVYLRHQPLSRFWVVR